MIASAGFQAQGSRKEQQDSYGILNKKDKDFISHAGVLAVVADGMGGLAQGREASQIAVKSFINAYKKKKPDESVDSALLRSLHACNKEVFEFSESQDLEGKLGTTIVAAVIQDKNLNWISVGDSRIHLIQQNEITCLTTDHNYESQLNELLAKGEITKEEAASHPQSAALTSFVGGEDISIIGRNTSPIKCFDTDQVLLSSDGLYARISDQEIVSITKQDPKSSVKELVNKKLGMKAKNQDNLTAVILQKKDKEVPKTNNTFAAVSFLTIIGLFIFLAVDRPFSESNQNNLVSDLETTKEGEPIDSKINVEQLPDLKANAANELNLNEAEEINEVTEAKVKKELSDSKAEDNAEVMLDDLEKKTAGTDIPIKDELPVTQAEDNTEVIPDESQKIYKATTAPKKEASPKENKQPVEEIPFSNEDRSKSIEAAKEKIVIIETEDIDIVTEDVLIKRCEMVTIAGFGKVEQCSETVFIAKPEDVVIEEKAEDEEIETKPEDKITPKLQI